MKKSMTKALATIVSVSAVTLILSTPARALELNINIWSQADGVNQVSTVGQRAHTYQTVGTNPGQIALGALGVTNWLIGGPTAATPGFGVTNGTYYDTLNGGPSKNLLSSSSDLAWNNNLGFTTETWLILTTNDFQTIGATKNFLTGSISWNGALGSSAEMYYYNMPGAGLAAPTSIDTKAEVAAWMAANAAYQVGSWNFGGAVPTNDPFTSTPYNFTAAINDSGTFSQALVLHQILISGGQGINRVQVMQTNAVPEPSTYVLLGLSLGVVGISRRKMGRQA